MNKNSENPRVGKAFQDLVIKRLKAIRLNALKPASETGDSGSDAGFLHIKKHFTYQDNSYLFTQIFTENNPEVAGFEKFRLNISPPFPPGAKK